MLIEGEKKAKSAKASMDGKANGIGPKTVLLTPPAPVITKGVKWELKYTAETDE